jgi:hypothetical protein
LLGTSYLAYYDVLILGGLHELHLAVNMDV